MEVFLLWLDNLDDTIFACLLTVTKASRIFLAIGSVAALLLLIGQLSSISMEWSLIPMGVAALSVGLWSIAALVDFGKL